jgi:hypothetical protein
MYVADFAYILISKCPSYWFFPRRPSKRGESMYACMYVCMYVCTIDHSHFNTTDETSFFCGIRGEKRNAETACMHVRMYECMHACIYPYTLHTLPQMKLFFSAAFVERREIQRLHRDFLKEIRRVSELRHPCITTVCMYICVCIYRDFLCVCTGTF